MSGVPQNFIDAVRGGSYNLGIFLRVGTTPPLHLSFSTSDMAMAFPNLDDPGTVYTGAGRFSNLPDLEVLINGKADKVSFTLSGVDPEGTSLFLANAPPVLGALVTVGVALLDQRWQPATDVIPLWTGTGDYVSISSPPSNDPRQNRKQSITLSCYTGDTTRAQSSMQTNTSTYQQTMYPSDNFFNRVSRYFQNYVVSWPRF